MRIARFVGITALLSLIAVVQVMTSGYLESQPQSNGTTVYVTRTGTKYHRAGCTSLSKSAIPMRLEEAAARYAPCSRCKPPVQPSTEQAATQKPASQSLVSPAVSSPETLVYTKQKGLVYHFDENCVGLAGTPKEVHRLSDVQTVDYGLCSVCGKKAGAVGGAALQGSPSSATPKASTAPTSTPGQCQAITKSGRQCSRRAQPGSQYCWQHQR